MTSPHNNYFMGNELYAYWDLLESVSELSKTNPSLRLDLETSSWYSAIKAKYGKADAMIGSPFYKNRRRSR